jgi:hypothetical protein
VEYVLKHVIGFSHFILVGNLAFTHTHTHYYFSIKEPKTPPKKTLKDKRRQKGTTKNIIHSFDWGRRSKDKKRKGLKSLSNFAFYVNA